MPLEWIFGSKKKSEPEQPIQENVAVKRDDEDEFVMLSQSEYIKLSTSSASQLPYSLAPASTSPVQPKQQQEPFSQQHGFLHGVPFKLACNNNYDDTETITSIHLHASQHVSFIKHLLSSNTFDYSFTQEDNVIRQ